jgi:hypothetical protein
VTQHARRPGVHLVQEFRGFLQPALADAELGQPDLCFGRLSPVRVAEPGDGGLELTFRLLPLPARDQGARVVGAADGDHQLERPPFAELPQPLAPLGGAPDVAHPLAGGDQTAGDGAGLVDPRSSPEIAAVDDSSSLLIPSATSPSLTSARPS